ncbi:ATP-dependent DNA helicase PIF1-like [Acropora muricata]|uniref:ATP-dependent DNA helicase PIF1-like n=1 Tax=Acropora muricata TaxID=159855 RepID=UPI0034E60378
MYDPKGKPYKSGTTLVGVKVRSPFKDEYYYQDVLMNYAHRSTEELKHENHDHLPVGIKYFAAAFSLRPELWTDETKIREHFSLMGNKDEYVDTLIANEQRKRDFLHLWQRRASGGISDLSLLPDLNLDSDFSPEQLRVHSLVEKFLAQRQEYYDDIPEADYDSDNESLDSDTEYAIDERNIQSLPSTSGHDWRKFLLVRGKPGTGKTFAVLRSIRTALEAEYKVLCATPTGMLSSTYNSIIPDEGFNADTIHSAFKYPVSLNERPVINWDIANYDLLVVDELSMVPSTVFDHILTTLQELHVRPVVLLCGDQQQQQPIATIQGKTRPTTGILQNKVLYKNSVIMNFVKQHRRVDAQFQEILNVIRYYKPSRRTLKELHGKQVLCSPEPTEAELLSVLQDHPDGMILTVTRAAAATINRIAVNNLFPDVDPCGYVKYDGTDKLQPIYKGMKVIITQNRDKELHIVNGQTATVHTMQNATVFLKLSNDHIVAVYPVTATVDDYGRTSHPFVPAYASTICKIQGQNLGKIILWLDTPLVPKGSAYVALSRIRHLKDLFFITETHSEQYSPTEHFAL